MTESQRHQGPPDGEAETQVVPQEGPGEGQRAAAEEPVPPAATGARREGVGLCLSGGGFRAALFHLGATRRLNELGILGQVRTISAVSGGSITANLLADPRLVWPDRHGASVGGEALVVQGFEEFVAEPLRRLASRNVRTPALLSKLLPSRWAMPDSAVRALADAYLKAVPWWSTPLRDNETGGPAIVIGSTDVAYGVDWTFADPTANRPDGRMGDYRLGYAAPPRSVRLADAVAASCAFPPFFAPMTLVGTDLGLTGGHPDHETPEQRAAILEAIRLTDGGVYDNLGLEPVWRNHATVLVSDGGAVFRAHTERTVWGRLLQILGVATGGGSSVRLRWLHASFARNVMAGSTWGLDTVVPEGYDPASVELINAVRSDLDAFTRDEQRILERHGYLVADHVVRRYVPGLVRVDAPLRPPHPKVADHEVVRRALRSSAKRALLGRW